MKIGCKVDDMRKRKAGAELLAFLHQLSRKEKEIFMKKQTQYEEAVYYDLHRLRVDE